MSKRALRARLGMSSDAHLAKVLKLPTAEVEGWPEEQSVPALPQVMRLLGVQETPPAAEAAPTDPDADRIINVEAA
jgi:DNA-binding transcriptional regulator YiaG